MQLIVGKIYANWCGHCKNLIQPWNEMQNKVNHKVKVVKFEGTQHANELENFKKTYPVDVQQGYPTLFRIVHEKNAEPKIKYYSGQRDAPSLIFWALHGDAVPKENKPIVTFIGNRNIKVNRNVKRNKQNKKTAKNLRKKSIKNRTRNYRKKYT